MPDRSHRRANAWVEKVRNVAVMKTMKTDPEIELARQIGKALACGSERQRLCSWLKQTRVSSVCPTLSLRRRLRLSHAKVRSTIHWRGTTSKTAARFERFAMSIVQFRA